MNCLIAICHLFTGQNFYVGVSADFAFNATHITAKRSEGYWCDSHWCRGPLMEARVGFQGSVSRTLELDIGLRHQSFALEDDRGRESAYVSVTWRPWR